MKTKIAVFFLLCAALISCNENNLLDPNAMISLRPAASQQHVAMGFARNMSRISYEHLSGLEIVKQAANLKGIRADGVPWGRGFDLEHQRDSVAPRLMMWGTDIIEADGTLEMTFITSTDMVLERILYTDPITHDTIIWDPYKPEPYVYDFDRVWTDTIAYIPNATITAAREAIIAAHGREDYQTCYRIFDTAFTFIPITGAEWRALKAANQQ